MAKNHNTFAEQYIASHKDDTIYAHGRWWRYGPGVWEPIHDLVIELEIKELLKRLNVNMTASLVYSVISLVRPELFIPDDQMDAYPNLINMKNGTYDFETGAGLTHNPKHYFTSQLHFAYDSTADAPNWFKYLESTLILDPRDTGGQFIPDPELIDFVQEAVGYSLTNDNRFHITFWCLGRGRNGKGVLFHVLERLAGSAATTLNLNLLNKEQYQLANLVGKRIALCSEANSTDNLVEDATIKSLIAGDTMTVRMIRREPFELRPRIKLWWSMNRLPSVADTSVGFWSRIRIVPFHRIFQAHERDLDLKEKLDDELPGIFNWAMRGLQRMNIQGSFIIPKQVIKYTENYRRESNTVEMFIDDCCTKGSGSTSTSYLYSTYKTWCLDNGYKALSNKNLKRELELLGIYMVHRMNGNVYDGINIKP
jgi:putative DNA primase/helicase